MPTEPSRQHVLSLSDDDFGSHYGRDRTAKEVAMKDANDRAGYKAAEEEYFKDKRQPKSDLIRQAELDKMKEILNTPKGGAKGPSGGGGSGGMGTGKMNRDISKNMKSGGKVSSASKRADGCCVKGKTKGKMV
jgi:hypothetical protein